MRFEGYTYTLKYTSKNYFIWKCSTKNYNCIEILRTSILKTDPSVTTEHNHYASLQSEVNVLKALQKTNCEDMQIQSRFMSRCF